jgi:hypothetical protein
MEIINTINLTNDILNNLSPGYLIFIVVQSSN